MLELSNTDSNMAQAKIQAKIRRLHDKKTAATVAGASVATIIQLQTRIEKLQAYIKP